MDHSDSLRMQAVERYFLGDLPPGERAEFEEHFFECPDCAQDVRATSVFLDGARQILREPSGAPAKVRRRFPRLAASVMMPPAWAAAAAVFMGLTVYQSLLVIPRLESELARARGPQAASWYFLSVSRAEPRVVTVSADDHMVGLTLSRGAGRTFPYYRCEVKGTGDAVLFSAVLPGPPAGEELQLLIPVGGLSPGGYVLAVEGLDAPAAARAGQPTSYHFTLRHRGD